MNLTVSTRELQNALKRVAPVIRRSSSLPIICNVLFATGENELRISATSLDLYLTLTIPAVVKEPGSVVLPDRTLAKWLETLPAGDLNISEEHYYLTFSQPGDEDNGALTIQGLDAKEFPSNGMRQPRSSPAPIHQVAMLDPEQTAEFRAALVRARPFASLDASARPVINTVMIRFTPTGISMEATDGFRCISTQTGIPCPEEMNALIPLPFVSHIIRLLPAQGTALEIYSIPKNAMLALTWEGVEMVFTLTDGKFPDLRVLMPKNNGTVLRVNRALLLNALRQARIIFSGYEPMILCLAPDSDAMESSVNSSEIGAFKRRIPVKYYGEAMKIAFNPFLLYDVASTLDLDTVEIKLNSNKSPISVMDDKSTMLLMPMFAKNRRSSHGI